MSTDDLRNNILAKRAAMHANLCSDYSAKITDTLLQQSFFDHAKHIALYLSHRNEVITERIVQACWEQNKLCYLPVLAPDTPNSLHFVAYTEKTKLQANQFKILEPSWDINACRPAEDLDLVLSPLVAFDAECNRIGMGAGYYDRSFAFLNASPRPKHPILIGLAYELQKTQSIHPQPWDVGLNAVVTEERIYQRNFA